MGLFFGLLVFWASLLYGGKYLRRKWLQRRLEQPARFLSEIASVDYYRRLTPAQFEPLAVQATALHKFKLQGDPFLGRGKHQLYAWKKNKKSVLVFRPETPLTLPDLEDIARRRRMVGADQAIVFSPFPRAPKAREYGVEVLAGRKFVSWLSVLHRVHPPLIGGVTPGKCDCGAPMRERVSRVGIPLLVCSTYPDCRIMRRPPAPPAEPPRPPSAGDIRTGRQTGFGQGSRK